MLGDVTSPLLPYVQAKDKHGFLPGCACQRHFLTKGSPCAGFRTAMVWVSVLSKVLCQSLASGAVDGSFRLGPPGGG